jgi:hypothetical protein
VSGDATPALPEALRPWAPWLSGIAPPLALRLGELLQRMQPFLGRFHPRQGHGGSEPDGVDDLQRRGRYERLLATEWLLAGELPDEFLRRAASGEHLFLSPRATTAQADRHIVALFDTGPWQLGAPRLVHLALVILLARRAQDAGGELRWGSLQRPGELHALRGTDDLKRLLTARSTTPAGHAAWPAWQQWLDGQGTPPGECWCVGASAPAPGLRGATAPSHLLQVRLAWPGDSLDVHLRHASATRRLQLPLPPHQPAAQLLRGQFQPEVTPADAHQQSERLSLRHAPWVAPTGNLVAVPLLSGNGVMIFPVPERGSLRKTGRHRRQQWVQGAEPLCGQFVGKSLGVLLSQPGALQFWQTGHIAPRHSDRPPREQFHAPPGGAQLLQSVWLRNAGQDRIYVLDADRKLVFWVGSREHGTRGPMLLHENVVAVAPVNGQQLVFVTHDANQRLCVRLADGGGTQPRNHRLPFEVPSVPRVHLAGAGRWNSSFAGCAVRVSEPHAPETWRLLEGPADDASSPRPSHIELPPGARGIGLVHLARRNAYALVVLSAHGRELTLHGATDHDTLVTMPSAAERATVCPISGTVAVLTADRALHVVSSESRTTRLVVHSVDDQAPDDGTA